MTPSPAPPLRPMRAEDLLSTPPHALTGHAGASLPPEATASPMSCPSCPRDHSRRRLEPLLSCRRGLSTELSHPNRYAHHLWTSAVKALNSGFPHSPRRR